jgi:hypothetical protein
MTEVFILSGVKRIVLGGGVLALLLAGCGGKATTKDAAAEEKGPPPPSQRFKTRPDLKPPIVKIQTPARGTAPGYVFFAPKLGAPQAGPMIMDNRGELVWLKPLKKTRGIADFRVQRYRGRPVLTWWRGRVSDVGVGENGWYVIYDDTYRAVAEVRAGNGLVGDIHEFLITRNGTALFTVYHRLPVDLSSLGGPKEGKIFDGIVQEVDISTGRVLFEWHSWPEVGLKESYSPPPKASKGKKASPYDYFHANSVDVDTDGNFLVSARNTHAVYKVNRKTGKIMWRLGGKKSDFKMGAGTKFAWQHDARRQPDGTITIFDNSAAPPVAKFSRVLVLRVDTSGKTATLVRSYQHPKKLLVPFEGNSQFLQNGNVLVGWGAAPYISELDPRGRVLFDAYYGQGKPPGKDADTYRAYRFEWHGYPIEDPVAAVRDNTLYVSWNGATEVVRWQVLAGSDPKKLQPVKTAAKSGFETAIPVQNADYFAVRALDRNGVVLATSRAVRPSG